MTGGIRLYTLSAYYHKSKIDFMDKKHPLFIGSCGTYHLYTIEKLPPHRPKGRLDYQLLYIASGRAHFYFDGKPTVVEAGNMVLYRPKEEQRYYYYGADQTEVYTASQTIPVLYIPEFLLNIKIFSCP